MFNRTKILASGVAAVGAGALLAGPLGAAAQEDTDPTETTTDETTTDPASSEAGEGARPDGGWLKTALDELVTAGTITQEQADAVVTKLEEARPERGGGWGHGRGGRDGWGAIREGLADVAGVIGIEEDALREAVRGGQTLAEIATANGVEPQAVIDVLVENAEARIDEAVTAGRIDETEAAERSAAAVGRITEMVNEGRPARGDRDDADGGEVTDEAPATSTTQG